MVEWFRVGAGVGAEKVAVFFLFILVLLFAWLLGKFATQLLVVSYEPKLQQNTAVNFVAPQGSQSFLFGKPLAKTVEKSPKVVVEDVKDSRLDVTLVGVIDMPGSGVAFIKRSNKTSVVFEGGEIVANVFLVEVFPTEVVIDNNGVQEKLSLARDKNTLLIKEGESGVAVEPSGRSLSYSSSSALSEIGSVLKKSPMSIAKFIRFKPINKAGKLVGVKLWSKTDKKLFRELGFKEGDLLVRVNGESIDLLASNPALWQKFLKESQFELIVDRNGQQYDISVDLSGS